MKFLFSVILIVFSRCALAEVTSYFGYTSDGNVDGFEFQVGSFHQIRDVLFDINYLGFVTYSGESPSGYRSETFSNGTTVCRDVSTGRFSEKENCKAPIELKYAPSIEASYLISDGVSLGLGYRLGNVSGAIGLLNFSFFEQWRFSIKVGSEYVGLGLGVRL